jgi:hypothetical protein
MCNIVFHRTQIQQAWERNGEENIWAQEATVKRKIHNEECYNLYLRPYLISLKLTYLFAAFFRSGISYNKLSPVFLHSSVRHCPRF